MAQREYSQNTAVAQGAAIDAGLQQHMSKIYAWMASAMIVAGLVAYVVGMDVKAFSNGEATTLLPPALLAQMFTSPIVYIIMFSPLALVMFISFRINSMSVSTAQIAFYAFAAVKGLAFSWIFAVFTAMSIAQVFFITAIAFGALSIWGYTTKKDLSAMGTFLIMGVVGLLVAAILNIFLQSEVMQSVIAGLGLLIFAGLTAYYTQEAKREYLELRNHAGTGELIEKSAIMSALGLFISFMNMFMFLLHFMGQQE